MRVFIFFLLLPYICISQQTIDAEQFFTLGLSNFKQIEQATGSEVDFPWIDQYEFRTETRDFDLAQQEYTVRLSPSTAKIRNAQKAYSEIIRNTPDFEGQEIYCDYVSSLHSDWLSLFILQENRSILNKLSILLNDKQSIYEKMLGSYEFDPEKLVSLQTEKSDLAISINKLQLEWDYLLTKYGIQDQAIDFNDFITVKAVYAYLLSNILSANESGMLDLEIEHEKQLLMKEIELESSERKQLIDFVQVKYNGPHSDEWQERLSVGLGFQLSKSGKQKLKMQELQIEQEELNRESERKVQEKKEELIVLENKLQSDIQSFFHFQKVMEEERTQLQNLSKRIAQKEGTSPLFLLNIEERHLSMKIKSLKKREDLFQDYLEYLQESDRMCEGGFVNYFRL